MKYLIAFLLFLPTAYADEWTLADTKRESVYIMIDTVDWLQTRQIAKNPDKWQENNKILGSHPSVEKVDKYFAMMGLAHIAIAYHLPADYRKLFQYVSIGFEAGMVANNLSVGIRIF